MTEPKTAEEFAKEVAWRHASTDTFKTLFRQAMLQAYRQGCEDCIKAEMNKYAECFPPLLLQVLEELRDSKREEDF